MKVITTEKIPLKLWLDDIEEGALEQAKNLANLPFAFSHIAIMPDSHQGYGMPIGGVMATHNVIVPNAVGVDIGCGMCFVGTDIKEVSQEMLKAIMGDIRKAVPVGFSHHKEGQAYGFMPDNKYTKIIEQQYENALTQVGTLGGGNHFIELQKDENGNMGIMIHSGSRNLGKQVADFYNNQAETMRAKYFSSVPKEWELAFLPIDEAHDYITDMNYCVEFALSNRKLMMNRIVEIVKGHISGAVFDDMINIAHNYARIEHHFGKDVWVHRKGATSAKVGEVGIIPGSMGTSSYLVEGVGNIHSFQSCSHGAGRKMGRKEAQRTLNLEEEQKKMEGILGAPRTQDELEEASGAYKNIDVVMENQKDLVKIIKTLKPIAVIKG